LYPLGDPSKLREIISEVSLTKKMTKVQRKYKKASLGNGWLKEGFLY